MVLRFGKFRGEELSAVPSDYLAWLLSLGDGLREPLRSAVETEIRQREVKLQVSDEEIQRMMSEIVSVGYRHLSLKLHPDKGGSHTDQVALNLAASQLREGIQKRLTDGKAA
jgi:hypothetical protein